MSTQIVIGASVVVHDDDGATPARVTHVGIYRDPVSRREDVVAVSVRTDGGDEWCGIPIQNIEVLSA